MTNGPGGKPLKFGGSKELFKQLRERVDTRHKLLFDQIKGHPGLDKMLERSLLAKRIKDEPSESYVGKIISVIEDQLRIDKDWDNVNGDEKHVLLLEGIEKYMADNPNDQDFRQGFTNLEDSTPAPTAEEKKDFYDFIMTLSIISVANPYLRSTYLMKNLPKDILIDDFHKLLINLLMTPNKFIANPSFFPTTTNRHANSMVRILLLEKINAKKNGFSRWGTFLPYDEATTSQGINLQRHTEKMLDVAQNMSKNQYGKDIALARGKLAKNIGYLGLTTAILGGIAVAGGATIAAGALTAGIAVIAIGVIAVAAFAYYRYKTCSRKKELLASQEKHLRLKFSNKQLEPSKENMYDSINKGLFDLAQDHEHIKEINAIAGDDIASELGSSVTVEILKKVIENFSEENKDENEHNPSLVAGM